MSAAFHYIINKGRIFLELLAAGKTLRDKNSIHIWPIFSSLLERRLSLGIIEF